MMNVLKSVQAIIAISIFVIVSVTAFVQSYFMYKETKKELIHDVMEESGVSLLQLSNSLATFVKSYEVNEYEKLVENEMGHKNILAIVVEDFNMGKVLGKGVYVSGKIRDKEWRIVEFVNDSKEHKELLKDSIFTKGSDIVDDTGKIATVTIYSSDELVKKELDTLVDDTIFRAIAIIALLVLFLIIAVNFAILKPLSEIISKVTDRDEDGIPREMIKNYETIEISTLVTSINNMIYAVKVSRKDLKENKEKLRESEFRWRFAVDGSGSGLWDWNLKTNSVYFSEQWKRMLGFEPEEIAFELSEWDKRVHPEDKERAYEDINKHIVGETDVYENTHRLLCKDGTYKWILDRGVVVDRDSSGKAMRMIGTHTDITKIKTLELEIKKLNESLEEKVEEKSKELIKQKEELFSQSKKAAMGELIGAIAHQLKQPINSISLYADVVKDDVIYGEMTPERADEIRGKIQNSVKFMSKSIDDLRNFYSPDKKSVVISLKELIEKTLGLLNSQLINHQISIEFDGESELSIEGIESEFQQVIINIVTNAKDALLLNKPENPTVKIALFRDGDRGVITIEDNGGGIDESDIEKVFDSYFTTKGEEGTGIGLNLARMIVQESLDGEIRVENGEKGARFTVSLKVL